MAVLRCMWSGVIVSRVINVKHVLLIAVNVLLLVSLVGCQEEPRVTLPAVDMPPGATPAADEPALRVQNAGAPHQGETLYLVALFMGGPDKEWAESNLDSAIEVSGDPHVDFVVMESKGFEWTGFIEDLALDEDHFYPTPSEYFDGTTGTSWLVFEAYRDLEAARVGLERADREDGYHARRLPWLMEVRVLTDEPFPVK